MYHKDTLLDCALICDDSPNCYSPEAISEILDIYTVDKIIILIVGFCGLFASSFVIYTFFRFKETREQPGDLLLAISISEVVLIMHWMSMVIYDIGNGEGPLSDGGFCQGECFFSIAAGTSEFIYNCLFCVYIIMKVRNKLQGKEIHPKWYHITAAIVVIGVVSYCYGTGSTGLSLFGMCSFKQSNNFAAMGMVIVGLYLILSSYTIIYFKRKIPKNDFLQRDRAIFLNYFVKYIIMQTTIWVILAVSNLMTGLNCTVIQNPGLNVFVTIGNTAKLATSFCLSIIRYQDPNISSQIRPYARKIFCCLKKNENDSKLRQPLIGNGSKIISTDVNKPNFWNSIGDKLRISQIYTIIAGVQAGFKFSLQNYTLSLSDISKQDCQQKYVLNLYQHEINKIPSQTVKQGRIMIQDETKMTMYAPKVFKSMVEIDQKMVNLDQAFDINDNIQDITNKFGDGGKSGSFFYFTKDRSMIIKSMEKAELDKFLDFLYDYCQYLGEHEDSFISKIYGVFTFKKGDLEEHILIMRHLQNCPDKYNISRYDLKGSTVARSVIPNDASKDKAKELVATKTLKDMDFRSVERNGKVHIEHHLAERSSAQLIKDAQFFDRMKLMDYSLFIQKIDWATYSIQLNKNEKEIIENRFTNDLYCIPSTLEPGIYYHMGIIDYLQQWNKDKIAEMLAKKFVNVDFSLDISAKPPDEYSLRFQQNIAKLLFLK